MVFLVQAFTGILLMASYSPSSTMAWASVFYISHDVWYGWFIRGLHHFSAQAMMVLLGLHLLQVVWAGAYRRPREFNWWFGVALLLLTIGFGHTGYQLPWDQKGYWSTKVVTSIIGGTPVVGPYLQKIVVGGSEFGNQTLTRFYALHVAVLPALLVTFLVVHIVLSHRHRLTPPAGAETLPATPYWPEQVFRNVVFGVLVLGVVVGVVLFEGGASLDAPADPSSAEYPARPEWYYLSLFQMLKYFPGKREVIGTIVIPSSLLLVMLILPLLDRVLPRKLAHFLACGFVFVLAGGAGFLTVQALWDDYRNPLFQEARKKADAARERALELAGSEVGIPPDGAAYLLVATRRPMGAPSWSGDASAATSTAASDRGRRRRPTWRDSAPGPGSAASSRIRRRRATSAKSLSATGWPSGRKAPSSRVHNLMRSPNSSPRSPGSLRTRPPASGSRALRSPAIRLSSSFVLVASAVSVTSSRRSARGVCAMPPTSSPGALPSGSLA